MNSAYEQYPLSTMLMCSVHAVLVYACGAFIMYKAGAALLGLYIAYLIFMEMRVYKHCADCWYFGKACAFGRGKLAPLFVKQGDPKRFCAKEMTPKDMLPDMLVAAIPLVTGIILIIAKHYWLALVPMALLVLLVSAGNAFVRGTLACPNCKQKDLGCPASKLFNSHNSGGTR